MCSKSFVLSLSGSLTSLSCPRSTGRSATCETHRGETSTSNGTATTTPLRPDNVCSKSFLLSLSASLTSLSLAHAPPANQLLAKHTAEKPRQRIDTAAATPHYPRLGVLRESDIRRTTLHQYGRITLPENRWKWDSLHTPYSYNASLTFNKLTPFSSWPTSTTDSKPAEINSATCGCVIFERKP